jgi:hypothetical protein
VPFISERGMCKMSFWWVTLNRDGSEEKILVESDHSPERTVELLIEVHPLWVIIKIDLAEDQNKERWAS